VEHSLAFNADDNGDERVDEEFAKRPMTYWLSQRNMVARSC
jgi:hypothetical protein